jgi:hypothetical protein
MSKKNMDKTRAKKKRKNKWRQKNQIEKGEKAIKH